MKNNPIQKLLARSCKNLTQFMQVVSCTYLPLRNLARFCRIYIWASRILHSTAKSCNKTTSKIKMQDFLQESARRLARIWRVRHLTKFDTIIIRSSMMTIFTKRSYPRGSLVWATLTHQRYNNYSSNTIISSSSQ